MGSELTKEDNDHIQRILETGAAQQKALQTQLAQTPETQMLARWLNADDGVITNLPPNDPDYEYLLLATAGEADRKTRNAVGGRLRIAGFAVSVIELTDDVTGEVLLLERAVMLLEDGGTVSSTSSGVLRCLRVLAKSRGQGRWLPVVDAEIVERPLEGGKSYCTMKVARAAQAAKPGKK